MFITLTRSLRCPSDLERSILFCILVNAVQRAYNGDNIKTKPCLRLQRTPRKYKDPTLL